MSPKEQQFRIPGIRTFELVVNVSGRLEGELSDWPSHIQDRIMLALEQKSADVQRPLKIVSSGCGYLDSDEPGKPGTWYIKCIASEIVAYLPPKDIAH